MPNGAVWSGIIGQRIDAGKDLPPFFSFQYRAEKRYVILDLDGDISNRQWWIRLADE